MIWHSRAVSHKTHHEHNHPSVLTNQHFTIADLFVEAYIPAIIALSVLAKGLRGAVFFTSSPAVREPAARLAMRPSHAIEQKKTC